MSRISAFHTNRIACSVAQSCVKETVMQLPHQKPDGLRLKIPVDEKEGVKERVIVLERKEESGEKFDGVTKADVDLRDKGKGKEGNKLKPAEMKIGRHELVNNSQLGIVYSVRKYFHQHLSVLSIHDSVNYLLGVQIAGILKRKTFNLYHCMKKKHIELRRASQEQIEFLMSVGAVPIGTHSITFVPLADGLCFVADALFRYVRFPNEDPSSFILKKRRSYATVKHKINRRKPLPWDLQRSIKKTDSPNQQGQGIDPQNYYIQSDLPPPSKPTFDTFSLPSCFALPVPASYQLQSLSHPPGKFTNFLEAIS